MINWELKRKRWNNNWNIIKRLMKSWRGNWLLRDVRKIRIYRIGYIRRLRRNCPKTTLLLVLEEVKYREICLMRKWILRREKNWPMWSRVTRQRVLRILSLRIFKWCQKGRTWQKALQGKTPEKTMIGIVKPSASCKNKKLLYKQV